MRINKNICLIFALLLAGLLCTPIRADSPQPQIYLTPEAWDLGKISQNQTFTRTLEIYNAGNALLQIKDVRPSCGCTITDISTNEIYPCDSASLEVSFNSGGFEGKIKKKIYISSNDPQQPLVIFKIMAEVAEKRKKSSH